jgi:hypothetical protein
MEEGVADRAPLSATTSEILPAKSGEHVSRRKKYIWILGFKES